MFKDCNNSMGELVCIEYLSRVSTVDIQKRKLISEKYKRDESKYVVRYPDLAVNLMLELSYQGTQTKRQRLRSMEESKESPVQFSSPKNANERKSKLLVPQQVQDKVTDAIKKVSSLFHHKQSE